MAEFICSTYAPDMCIGFSGLPLDGTQLQTKSLINNIKKKSDVGKISWNVTNTGINLIQDINSTKAFFMSSSETRYGIISRYFANSTSITSTVFYSENAIWRYNTSKCLHLMRCNADAGSTFCSSTSTDVVTNAAQIKSGIYMRFLSCPANRTIANSFDLKTTCAPNCTVESLFSSTCHSECNNTNCRYNLGQCSVPPPTLMPSRAPYSNSTTNSTSSSPSPQPSFYPTNQPSYYPTNQPTSYPTKLPSTQRPTGKPTSTDVPTKHPTRKPTLTDVPTKHPTKKPTLTDIPTQVPTKKPTLTEVPTQIPTKRPTFEPTKQPSRKPSSVNNLTSNSPTLDPSENQNMTPSVINSVVSLTTVNTVFIIVCFTLLMTMLLVTYKLWSLLEEYRTKLEDLNKKIDDILEGLEMDHPHST